MAPADGFTCPLGGEWYACSSGSKFVGCCTTDPCSTGCVQGNIRQAAFNGSLYGTFPDASCDSASDFFTCTVGRTFWGCCKSVPCSDEPTCPTGDLVPAFLGRPDQVNYYAPSPSSTEFVAEPKLPSSEGKGKHSRAVIGGVVGGILFLAILIAALVFLLCRRKKKQKRAEQAAATIKAPTAPVMEKKFSSTEHMTDAVSPPPTYTTTHPSPDMYTSPTKPVPTPSPYSPHHIPHSSPHVLQQWAHHGAEPQELPADITPASPVNTNLYSELPAAPPTPHQPQYAELSAVKTALCSIDEVESARGLGVEVEEPVPRK